MFGTCFLTSLHTPDNEMNPKYGKFNSASEESQISCEAEFYFFSPMVLGNRCPTLTNLYRTTSQGFFGTCLWLVEITMNHSLRRTFSMYVKGTRKSGVPNSPFSMTSKVVQRSSGLKLMLLILSAVSASSVGRIVGETYNKYNKARRNSHTHTQ